MHSSTSIDWTHIICIRVSMYMLLYIYIKMFIHHVYMTLIIFFYLFIFSLEG